MTVFNVGYSSLEDAWGDMAGRKKKKKSPPQDPVCDLYEMKGNSSAYSETDLVNYAYDKSRSQRTYNSEAVAKKATINKDDEVFEVKESKGLPKSLFEKQFDVRHPDNFETEDPKEYMVRSCKAPQTHDESDDVYDDEAVRHKNLRSAAQAYVHQEEERDRVPQEHSRRELRELVDPRVAPRHESVYDETPAHTPRVSHERAGRRGHFYATDESDVEPEEPPRPHRKPRQRRVFQEEDTDIESEYEYRKQMRQPQQKHVYLDIILYVVSGIILIFLLEQFVRIGINMQSV